MTWFGVHEIGDDYDSVIAEQMWPVLVKYAEAHSTVSQRQLATELSTDISYIIKGAILIEAYCESNDLPNLASIITQ